MWGALSDERTGLSFARVTVNSNNSVVSMYNLYFTCYQTYVYTIYTGPLSVLVQYRRSCPIISSSCYYSSRVTWPPPSLSLLYFLCLGTPCPMLRTFAFSWFCMTSACCQLILTYNHICTEVWKPCANREPMCALENFQLCGELCFAGAAISVNSHEVLLMIALWRVPLMLALNRSLLYR
jgi:hypothetical protein